MLNTASPWTWKTFGKGYCNYHMDESEQDQLICLLVRIGVAVLPISDIVVFGKMVPIMGRASS